MVRCRGQRRDVDQHHIHVHVCVCVWGPDPGLGHGRSHGLCPDQDQGRDHCRCHGHGNCRVRYQDQDKLINMNNFFEITLLIPPSVNEYLTRGSKQGKRYRMQPACVKWRIYALYELKKMKDFLKWQMLEVPSKITCDFKFNDNRRRDASNYIKAIYDSLTVAQIVKDDSLFHDEHIMTERGVDIKEHIVNVKVEKII